jgi:hypothetical protein
MRAKFVLAAIVFSVLSLWAADKLTPLKVKLGLWENTVTHSMTGMPAMPAISPDTLAKMPPEQRARIEAMMKQSGMGGPATNVSKYCITQEKIDKQTAFDVTQQVCTRTVVSSTSSRLEMKLHCEQKQATTDGTVVVEVTSSESTKGTAHMVTNAAGRNMNMDVTFSSKYLGPDCGDVK